MPNLVEIFDKAFDNFENTERRNSIKEALIIKQKEIEKLE